MAPSRTTEGTLSDTVSAVDCQEAARVAALFICRNGIQGQRKIRKDRKE
jgi:hypothetical protein